MDEAQRAGLLNLQAKMELTRLPSGKTSGLDEVVDILQGVEGIKFVRFSERDVVRHPLVAKIVRAYREHEGSAPE